MSRIIRIFIVVAAAAIAGPVAVASAKDRFEVAVHRVGDGFVYTDRGGISCGFSCEHKYLKGTAVKLLAKPDPGWELESGCVGCTFIIDHDIDLKFVFKRNEVTHRQPVSGGGTSPAGNGAPGGQPQKQIVTLVVTKSGSGTGVIKGDLASGIDCGSTCTVSVPAGTYVSLVPSADPGSVFDGWSTTCPNGAVSCGVTLTTDTTVDAVFNKVSSTGTPGTGGGTDGPSCTGTPTVLFSNSNGNEVLGGGSQPSFSTNGQSYCLISISTYHWNSGLGAAPGTIGLESETGTIGPWPATGSTGSPSNVYPQGVPNANWTATPSSAKQPVIINGTYSCSDSDPASWAQDGASSGAGFCTVTVEPVNLG
jgi:hypothetical protein